MPRTPDPKRSHRSKLIRATAGQVRKVEALAATGESRRSIAAELHLCQDTLRLILGPVRRNSPHNRFAPDGGRIVDPYTCPGCERRVVYRPCQICRANRGGKVSAVGV